jgi:hypothetical protein
MASGPTVDSNTWYQLTESRVDFNSSLQANGNGVFFAAASPTAAQYWQFFPTTSSTYRLRNKGSGVKQLGTCHVESEVTAPKTQPCMVPAVDEESQEWILDSWPDGTFMFINKGNGTGYHMDVHPGNPVFMSANVDENPKKPAQHWSFMSIGDINDGTFSTEFGAVSTFILVAFQCVLCFHWTDVFA